MIFKKRFKKPDTSKLVNLDNKMLGKKKVEKLFKDVEKKEKEIKDMIGI